MNRKKLTELIKTLLHEYTGTGDSGGNAGDGNNMTSPRPFKNAKAELKNYLNKSIGYGGDGGHYRNNVEPVNYNHLNKPGMMEELKKQIKKLLKELNEQSYGSATLTTQGQQAGRGIGVQEDEEDEEIKEQVSAAAQKTYEAGLKRLQKDMLWYQYRWIEKQMAAATSQAATASQDAKAGFIDQLDALRDQIRAIDNPPKQGEEQNEGILQKYINERKNSNLMSYIDTYKRGVLLESAMSKFFNLFDEGNSDEEIIRSFAEKGIVVPEQFVGKARKKHESLKRDKLDLDELETETKNFKTVTIVDEDEFELIDDEKKLSSKLNEAEIIDRYPIPAEIEYALTKRLKMDPLIRFVKNLKAINSIPASYRVFLHNGEYFDVVYEEFSLMLKIHHSEYYLDSPDEKNYAIKHINKLLTQPRLRAGDAEEEEDPFADVGPPKKGGGGGGGGTSSPKPPSPPKPPSLEPVEPPEKPSEPEDDA